MTNPATAETRSNIIELQERRLDRTVLRTYRTTVDLDDVVPNGNQPRMGPKEDDELQRQIEANEGYSSPSLSNLIRTCPENSESSTVIDVGQTHASWSSAGASNIARFSLRSQTGRS